MKTFRIPTMLAAAGLSAAVLVAAGTASADDRPRMSEIRQLREAGKILPIDDASALGNIVVNNRRGPLAWLMLNATRLGFYLGVIGWTAQSLSLLARRETS